MGSMSTVQWTHHGRDRRPGLMAGCFAKLRRPLLRRVLMIEEYRGYRIEALWAPASFGRWSVRVQIRRIDHKDFEQPVILTGPETYRTEQEATEQAIQIGHEWIDDLLRR